MAFQTYYLHHSATNETSSFGAFDEGAFVEVIHNPPGKMNLRETNTKIVKLDEGRRIWNLLVGEGFKRREKG